MVRKKARRVLYEVLLVSYGLGPNRKTVCTTRPRPCSMRTSVYLPVQTFHIRMDSKSFCSADTQNGTDRFSLCSASNQDGGRIFHETSVCSGVPRRGVWGVQPPPKFRRPSKIVPNSTRFVKLLKLLNFGRQHPKMFGKRPVKF